MCIVILEVRSANEQQVIVLLVDAVSDVLEVVLADIESPLAFGSRMCTDFILDMGEVNGYFTILLGVGKGLLVSKFAALIRSGRSPPTNVMKPCDVGNLSTTS